MNDTKLLELGLRHDQVSPEEFLAFADSLKPESYIYFPSNLPPDKKPTRADIVDLAEEGMSCVIEDDAQKGWYSGIFHIRNKDGDRLVTFLASKITIENTERPVVLYRTTTLEEIKAIELNGMMGGPTRNLLHELTTWTFHYKKNEIQGAKAAAFISRCSQ